MAKCQITADLLLDEDGACIIQPRVLKAREEQALRTRKKAEVFTLAWVCCLMNDYCDEIWFERSNVFFSLEGETWMPSIWPLIPPKPKTWQDYVDARRLEITCGEAPFLVSRYDMGTGEIIPISMRVGLLDSKLRSMTTVELKYGVVFGKCDASDWFEFAVDLDGEAEAACLRAKKLRLNLNECPELEGVLAAAYKKAKSRSCKS